MKISNTIINNITVFLLSLCVIGLMFRDINLKKRIILLEKELRTEKSIRKEQDDELLRVVNDNVGVTISIVEALSIMTENADTNQSVLNSLE